MLFSPFIVMEHLHDKVVPVLTYVIPALNSYSPNSISYFLSLECFCVNC